MSKEVNLHALHLIQTSLNTGDFSCLGISEEMNFLQEFLVSGPAQSSSRLVGPKTAIYGLHVDIGGPLNFVVVVSDPYNVTLVNRSLKLGRLAMLLVLVHGGNDESVDGQLILRS